MTSKAWSLGKQRRSSGVSMIVLATLIGLLVIPIVGIFAFEFNRFQQLERQLEKICDAAALAGGRRLADADVTGAAGDAALATQYRQWQAMNAAYLFITSQQSNTPMNVLNSVPFNAKPGQPGYLKPWFSTTQPPAPQGVDQGVVQIIPANPKNNYQPVNPGDPSGRSILVKAWYNAAPAFGKFLGIKTVPLVTSSASGYPMIDVMLCLDMSGSMDDCTRITLVSELVRESKSAIAQLWTQMPPPYPSITVPPPICTFAAADYNSYYIAYDAYASWFKNVRDNGLEFDYVPIRQGRLRDVLDNAGSTVPNSGTDLNVLPLRHLYDMREPYLNGPNPCYWLDHQGTQLVPEPIPPAGATCGPYYAGTRWQPSIEASVHADPNLIINGQDPYGGCWDQFLWDWNSTQNAWVPAAGMQQGLANYSVGAARPGFDMLVANLGPICNSTALQPKFGPYTPGTLTPNPSSAFSFQGFQFSNLPTIVEAAEGNLETASAWKAKLDSIDAAIFGKTTGTIYANTCAELGGPLPSGAGYQNAYAQATRQVSQPYATVIATADTFLDTLAGADNVRVGFVSFDSGTCGQLPAPNTSAQLLVKDNPPAGIAPEPSQPLITVGLTDSGNAAAMANLKKSLQQLTPLRGTNIGQALSDAWNILEQGNLGRPRQKMIILLTDGINSSGQDPISVVKSWPNNSTPVYCVALNQLSDPAFIQQMQSSLGDGNNGTGQGVAYHSGNGAQYFQAPTPQALRDAMSSIARRIISLTQ